MKERCPCCLGAKKTLQLGMNYGDCKNCQGTGQVEKITAIFTKPEIVEPDRTVVGSVYDADSFMQKESATEHKDETHGKKKKHRD